MSESGNPQIRVHDLFLFQDRLTVMVGEYSGGDQPIRECRGLVKSEGADFATLTIEGEQMPGPEVPRGFRSVRTRSLAEEQARRLLDLVQANADVRLVLMDCDQAV